MNEMWCRYNCDRCAIPSEAILTAIPARAGGRLESRQKIDTIEMFHLMIKLSYL